MLVKKCSNIETNRNMRIYTVDAKNYKTVKEMAKIYTPLFTESSIRQMMHKNMDGINSCVFKLGGKVLFDVERFEKWFEGRKNGGNDGN